MIKIKLLVATTNKGKLREIKAALAGLPLEVLSLTKAGVQGKAIEKGKTFAANARAKSIFYSRFTPYLTLAEDSGLEVDVLGGAPGVLSARFAGPKANDEQNINKVLGLLKRTPPAKRRARFVCHLCLAQRGRLIKCFRGEVRGWITKAPKGKEGFGYDPIFFYRPFGRTFGEIPAAKKNQVSHRGRALRRMRAFLEEFLATAPEKAAVP